MSVQPQFSESPSPLSLPSLGALLLAGSLLGLCLGLRRRQALVCFGAAWFLVALLPVLVIPLNVLVNDHRLYLALLGPVIAVCALVEKRHTASRLWLPCVVVLFALIGALRDRDWKDERALWADAVRSGPEMPEARYNLAYALHQAGRLEEASEHYQRAVGLNPHYVRAHVNLGVAYRELGEGELAAGSLETALKLEPGSIEALNNLGLVRSDAGDYARAISLYEQAVDINDQIGELWLNLGLAYRNVGQSDKAIMCLRTAIALEPGLKDRFPVGE